MENLIVNFKYEGIHGFDTETKPYTRTQLIDEIEIVRQKFKLAKFNLLYRLNGTISGTIHLTPRSNLKVQIFSEVAPG